MQDIYSDFGIPDPAQAQAQAPVNNQPAPVSDSSNQAMNTDQSIENRVDELFGQTSQKSAQPQDAAQTAQPQQTVQPGTQPAQSTQPKQEIDPVKLFAEASPKAFFSESGELDSAKLNDYYLTNSKSFMKFVTDKPITEIAVEKPVEKPDPNKEYAAKVAEITDDYAAVVEAERAKGFTDTQIQERIHAYFNDLKNKRDNQLAVKREIEEQTKSFAPEIEQSRRDKLAAKVAENITEFSAQLEGLVNGLSGKQVLNMFVLDPKYGGKLLDKLIQKDIPGFAAMKPEDRVPAAKEWFEKFQANKDDLAHVAEFGRLRWQVDNFKGILEHAQNIGASKAQMKLEGELGKPSNIVNFNKNARTASPVDVFMGISDSVN